MNESQIRAVARWCNGRVVDCQADAEGQNARRGVGRLGLVRKASNEVGRVSSDLNRLIVGVGEVERRVVALLGGSGEGDSGRCALQQSK